MSATRNSISRRLSRNLHASPYSRPTTSPSQAPSSWSLSSLLSYLNPLSSLRAAPDDDDDDADEETANGSYFEPNAIDNATPPPNPPTVVQASPPPLGVVPQTPVAQSSTETELHDLSTFPTNSPSKNQEAVTQYLLEKEKEGKQLNTVEVEGLIAMLKKASEEVEQEPFRFSTSPSTPAGSPQPPASSSIFSFSPARSDQGRTYASTSLPTFTNSATTPSVSPRKMLSRNPNGEYRWVGGGSARRGGPSRASSPKAAMSSPQSDKKRRRVGTDKDSSTAESSGGISSSQTVPSMGTSTNGMNGTAAIPSTPTPNARTSNRFPRPLRASLNPKTTPAHPSPLRQSHRPTSAPSSPGSSSSPGSPSSRTSANLFPTSRTSTRAADVLTEIIEKVTPPPRHADVSNPYQTASPVKATKLREKRKLPERKSRAQANDVESKKSNAKESAKEKEMPSPRAIIEATVPKGAKRTRPPVTFAKPSINGTSDSDVRGSGRLETPEPEAHIEEPEEDFSRVTKKQKQMNEVTVEEIDDEDMDLTVPLTSKPAEIIEPGDAPVAGNEIKSTSAFSASAFGSSNGLSNGSGPHSSGAAAKSSSPPTPVFGQLKSSAPKEPSKLRTSFTAPENDVPTAKANVSPLHTPAPSNMPFFGKANGFVPPTQMQASIQTPTLKTKDPKAAALDLDYASLPVYAFNFTPTPLTNINTNAVHASAKAKAAKTPLSSLTTFDFSQSAPAVRTSDWAVADPKPPAQTSGAAWKCSTCDLQNPASATEKCTICEAPRPTSTPASMPAVNGFNWAAAGMKPANGSVSGSGWKCGTCDLQNPASATEKCTICEAPRPAVGAAATPAVKGFDWAAAGMKPVNAKAGWKCGTCDLQNPASATEKCAICESPRP